MDIIQGKTRYVRTARMLWGLTEAKGRETFEEYFKRFSEWCSEEDYLRMVENDKDLAIEQIKVDKIITEVKPTVKEEVKKQETCTKKPKAKRHRTENSECKSKNQKFYDFQRRLAFDRDKHRCVECKRKDFLQIHHIIERRNGGTDDISNLITLCPLCHAKRHMGQPVYKIMIKRARQLSEVI